MSQVSKRPLSKNLEEKLFSLFFRSLAKLSNTSDMQLFLFDLLGPVERTMLAKRFGIALLLAKGHTYETIKEALHVSQETIARVNISLNYQGNGYKMAIKNAHTDETLEKLLEKTEDIAINILPYSSLKRSLQENKKTTRKPKTIFNR